MVQDKLGEERYAWRCKRRELRQMKRGIRMRRP